VAVAHPEVAVSYTAGGRLLFTTPGDGDGAAAAVAALGPAFRNALELRVEAGDFAVAGLLAHLADSRADRSGIAVFVNRRRVHNRSLAAAVEQAHRGLLLAGRFPQAVVLLRCPPEAVDVNVHPTKREVRFREERAAFAAVERAVTAALAPARGFTGAAPSSAAAGVPAGGPAPPGAGGAAWARARRAGWSLAPVAEAHRPAYSAGGGIVEALDLPSAAPGMPAGMGDLRLVGQALSRYVVAESEAGLVIVDQHAAHERILYDRLLARAEAREAPEQQFLVPLLVELSADEAPRVEGALEELRALGLVADMFGPRTLRVSACPPETHPGRIEALIREIGADQEGGASRERAARSLACHSAVRFGQHMAVDEMRALLRDLAATPGGATCPHGRPTAVVLPQGQLERELRRR
jgi:DNA mismatch repair protein MutL